MADSDLSISAISNQKLTEVQEKAEVAIFKKALDQEGQVATTLIQSAGQNTLAPGVGQKLNTVA